MRLSAEQLDEYALRVNTVCEAASQAAQRAYAEARMRNPDASVADVRETIIGIAETLLATYGDASGEVGASAYDEMAEASGADVPAAFVADPDQLAYDYIDSHARYLVGQLVPDREDI